MAERAAGPSRLQIQVPTRSVTDEELIADLAGVAALNQSSVLTAKQYDQQGKYHSTTLKRRLGSWSAACKAAGLEGGREDLGHPHEAWMENILAVWKNLGKQPSYGDMRGSRFSPEGYAKRYGSWTGALHAFQAWVDDSEVDYIEPETTGIFKRRGQGSGRTPSLRLRFKVLQRDGFKCVVCGTSPAGTPGTILHVDHKVPYSKGGLTDAGNLQTLCDRCNLGKADL